MLTRGERIKVLMDKENWQDGRSPFNLLKVGVAKVVVKKVKKAKEEEKAEVEGAEGAAAAPAAEAKPAGEKK